MKICLMLHPKTSKRFSYLTASFPQTADIAICFPEEDPMLQQADIFILEEEEPLVIERLLSEENPPLIVIPKAGTSQKHIRYLPDFQKQFPLLMQEITERTPSLLLLLNGKSYFFNQHDILYLSRDGGLSVYFRQGNHLSCKLNLKSIANQLSPRLFFPVGTEFFVNAQYVLRIEEDGVLLQNGQKLPIESGLSEQVKNAYFKTKYFAMQPAR